MASIKPFDVKAAASAAKITASSAASTVASLTGDVSPLSWSVTDASLSLAAAVVAPELNAKSNNLVPREIAVTETAPVPVEIFAEPLIPASASLLISLNASESPIDTDTAALPASETPIDAAPATDVMLAASSAETDTLPATMVPPAMRPSTSVRIVFSV